jgi:membrane-bound inhibitor of C-type lysozyme
VKISFTTVTWYSQIVAIVLFVGVYFLGVYIGEQYEKTNVPVSAVSLPLSSSTVSAVPMTLMNNVTFVCPSGKFIAAQFINKTADASVKGSVDLELSDGRIFSLPQVISADGGRYANVDQSFVFWNKGNGAFIEENGTTTYSGCVTK